MRTASVRLPGHPDEASDLVAEAIVDEYLRRDAESRVRLSVQGGRGVMFVAGDVLSQADFDVSALVRRTLGELGITDEVEPFIALEPVPAERVSAIRLSNETPVTVMGYATDETDVLLPRHVVLARRVATALTNLREQDTECFWLGPDAEVTAMFPTNGSARVAIRVEHGTESLEKIRPLLAERLASALDGATLDVNPAGPCERRGLFGVSGSSGRMRAIYGSGLPVVTTGIGEDPRSASKVGTWLARAAARSVVRSGAKAVMVQATYLPGEMRPHSVRIRDEHGRDRSASIPMEFFSLERVLKEWWRPGICYDAARRGIVGDPALPWEE